MGLHVVEPATAVHLLLGVDFEGVVQDGEELMGVTRAEDQLRPQTHRGRTATTRLHA
jgi:hypothetical protein